MNLLESDQKKWQLIRSVNGPEHLVVRLLELGFTKGVQTRVVGRALFGSPVFVEVRGAVLALRENEAECIQI